jgi:hypothetical protein
VESHEHALQQRFLGSPTVRVNGMDVEPGADARRDYGIKCRLYRTTAGIARVPPRTWILAALEWLTRPSVDRTRDQLARAPSACGIRLAPKGPQDFQIPCLGREVLSVLFGKRVLVSKQQYPLAAMDRAVAVRRRPHLLPSAAALATELLPSCSRYPAKSLETVRALRTRTRWKKAGSAARSHFCAPTGRSGDGGNRTRVRDRVKGSFYKLSRRLNLAFRRPRRRARPDGQPPESPRGGGSRPPQASPFLKPVPLPTGRGRTDSRYLAMN